MTAGAFMKSEWEAMTIDHLFELHEQMSALLREKLVAKKSVLERRLQQINQQAKALKTVRPDSQKLLMALGHGGWVWMLLPLVPNL
jgi:hypothetical protein